MMKLLTSSLSATDIEKVKEASKKIMELGRGASVKEVFDILEDFNILPKRGDQHENLYDKSGLYILYSERIEYLTNRDNIKEAWIVLEFISKVNPVCDYCSHIEYCKYIEKMNEWMYKLPEIPEEFKDSIEPSFLCKYRQPCSRPYMKRLEDK